MAIVEGGAALGFKLHACSRGKAKPVVDMVAARGFLWSGRQTCLSPCHLPPSACRSWRWIYLLLWLFAIDSLWCYLLV